MYTNSKIEVIPMVKSNLSTNLNILVQIETPTETVCFTIK